MPRVFLVKNLILKALRYRHWTFNELLSPGFMLLDINSHVGKDTHMEIKDSPGLCFRCLKLSSVDIFIDKYEGTGDKVFHSFEIYDNYHPVEVDLMKEIATFAKGSLDEPYIREYWFVEIS